MKQRELNLSAKVNDKGQLLIPMSELNHFTSKWIGKRLVCTFKVYDPGTSHAIRGYYFNKIVPDFKHAFWETGDRMTEKDTEKRIRELSPIMWEETPDDVTGEYEQRLRTVDELDNQELVYFIEHLKEIAAMELNFFIDDPNTL